MTVELFITKLQGRFPKLRENAVIRGDIEDGPEEILRPCPG